MTPDRPTRILFVCLGNICRSPLAEGVFIHLANQRGVVRRFSADSAGTGGWHEGELPDPRTISVAERNGIVLPSRARQITARDLREFDLIVCMDESNLENVLRLGAPPEKVKLLLDYDVGCGCREVPDPYTGGPEDFDHVYTLVSSACARLLDSLIQTDQSERLDRSRT